ncbi:MAG: caa(3)-type oxidase, subunit [Pedosphaera sp.]|jgi:cytochrome c oxidase subunit 4|nr:caa(3)-type oxidase, subunit [Pedosphaera sp.]
MSTEIVSKKIYFVIWASLMVLLFVTWGVAQFDLGLFNSLAALTIAIIKMLLVILYFMHVRYSSRLTWVFAGAGFLWLMIMITLTLSDYTTRGFVRPYNRVLSNWQDKNWNHLPGDKPMEPRPLP